jgi:hypothetical protein
VRTLLSCTMHVTIAISNVKHVANPQDIWRPIAERLSPLLSLRVETQQRLFAVGRRLHPSPGDASNNARKEGVTLTATDIPFFVDADTWALESGRIVSGHVHPLSPESHGIPETLLHFVGYVPALSEQPMSVECSSPQSGGSCAGFTVERWGGVAILNNASYREDAEAMSMAADESATTVSKMHPARIADYLGLAVQQFPSVEGPARVECSCRLPRRWP